MEGGRGVLLVPKMAACLGLHMHPSGVCVHVYLSIYPPALHCLDSADCLGLSWVRWDISPAVGNMSWNQEHNRHHVEWVSPLALWAMLICRGNDISDGDIAHCKHANVFVQRVRKYK